MEIKHVREKLFKIISICFDEEFIIKYNSALKSNNGMPELLMNSYSTQANNYIFELSSLISKPKQIKSLNFETDKNIIFTVFMRYHFFTSFLTTLNQDSNIDFPNEDESFFKEVLINQWQLGLSK